MSKFTSKEIAYFQSQHFGRLATVSPKGELHIAPVTFDYNALEDSIDISGYNMTSTKKYRDAIRHGRVAFLIDDILPTGQSRVVEIRGRAEAVPESGNEIKTMYSARTFAHQAHAYRHLWSGWYQYSAGQGTRDLFQS